MSEPDRDPARRIQPGTILRALAAGTPAELPALDADDQPDAVDEPGDGDPRLTIHRDGDRIERIVARCDCGRTLEIHCDYTPA